MRAILIIPAIAISLSLLLATTLERSTSPKEERLIAPQKVNAGNVGSWKDYIPNATGWIEVDPKTGKPLINDNPPMTNLNAKPQIPATDTDG
jgi:hypothetical protein